MWGTHRLIWLLSSLQEWEMFCWYLALSFCLSVFNAYIIRVL